jgi:hypothetical protein
LPLAVRLLAGLIAALVVGIGALFLVARLSDGPLAIVAGGPFISGQLAIDPNPDWSFVRQIREVEFQLLDPPRSRTTWIVEHAGKAYIPSGYMNSWWGRIWKQWPREALEDGRILLRIGSALYERRLVRVEDGPELEPILAELGRKYADGATIEMERVRSGDLWIFELAPRDGRR